MAIPKWPKNADEWRGALLFVFAAPLFGFNAFLMVLPIAMAVCGAVGLPGWRQENIIRTYQEVLFFPVVILSVALLALTIGYVVVDRRRATTGFLVLMFSTVASIFFLLPALARAREKPVIYLYPERERAVHVSLEYPGRITESEPSYADDGWWVTAWPDGALRDAVTGERYRFLFWEGRDRLSFGMDTGFVVAGSESGQFLREKLTIMGLSGTETDDFVEYWLPRLAAHPYNLISFPNEEFAAAVRLNVEPAPETVIRVFMVFRGLESPIDIPPQSLRGQKRRGFTVVEWGGTELE